MLGIIVAILVLSLVIVIHELGHFIAARKAGILCHEFYLGMGPILWSKKIGETTYGVRAIPLGGFVTMAGEEIEGDVVKTGDKIRVVFNSENMIEKIILDHENEKYADYELITVQFADLKGLDGKELHINEYNVKRDAFYVYKNREIQIAPADRNFNYKNKKQRFAAIFGGPFMNFVLAFFIFILFAMVQGFPTMDSSEIGFVGADYPAGGALIDGDVIKSVEGVLVEDWDDVSTILDDNTSDRNIEFVVERNVDGVVQEVTVFVTPTIYFYSVGFHSSPDAVNELIVGEIHEGTKAEIAGMQTGDQIVEINGETMATWFDVVGYMENHTDGSDLSIIVDRNGTEHTLTISEPWNQDVLDNQGLVAVDSKIGINPVYKFNFIKSIGFGFTGIKNSSTLIFDTLGLLFSSDQVGADDLAGPVGIYQITSSALDGGFATLLSWMGLLSVNLGVINLLPIPALDGGRLVFLGWEAITGKKANAKVENTLHYMMYLLLMGLFVFITYNDILRLFNLK